MEQVPYLVPCGDGESEFTEKRSRFIGHLFFVEDEAQARETIAQVKAQYHDARHNCWCYILREGGIERYSDDGEPQGTAGLPMLEVFRREGVTNLCFVSTRYFGGILLGAGGLLRAYTRSAKDTLDAVGIAQVSRWIETQVTVPYPLFERVKLDLQAHGALLGECEYAEAVTVRASLPQEDVPAYAARMTELSNGASSVEELGEVWRAKPREA